VRLGLVLLGVEGIDDHQFFVVVHHNVHPHAVFAVYHVVDGHILNEGQECENGYGEVEVVGWHIDVDVEFASISHLHDFAEGTGKFEFFLEGDKLLALALKDVAEDVGEMVDVADGEFVVFLPDQTADASQRVEEEVGVDLVGQGGATALQALDAELLQLFFLLLMDDAQVVGEAKEQPHHAHDEELEGENDGTASVEACADEQGDAFVDAVCHDGEHHVGQNATGKRFGLQPSLVEQEHAHGDCPKEEEAYEHVVDVTGTPFNWHIAPVPTEEEQVGIADKEGAHEACQQNLVEGFVVFHRRLMVD